MEEHPAPGWVGAAGETFPNLGANLSCTHQSHEDHEPGQLHSPAIDSFAGQEGEADAVPTEEQEPSVVLHQPLLGNHFGARGRGFQSALSMKMHK